MEKITQSEIDEALCAFESLMNQVGPLFLKYGEGTEVSITLRAGAVNCLRTAMKALQLYEVDES